MRTTRISSPTRAAEALIRAAAADVPLRSALERTQLVPAVTLDWLAARFPPLDVIKIDVEEAEVAVLAGGSRVLGLARTVICEVCGHNSAVVQDLLTAHGYVLYDGDHPPAERVPVVGTAPNAGRPWTCRDGGPMVVRLLTV